MENSSGEPMNMLVTRTTRLIEMEKVSMRSIKAGGMGTSMTNRMTTTPAASMMSPCLVNRS